MRRPLIALLSAAVLWVNLTVAASAVNDPTKYARQAGIISIDPIDRWNYGARSHFTTTTYQTPTVDGATQFFWIGQTLSDGSFYQAGILACGSHCLHWFAQAFDRYNNRILDWGWPSPVSGTAYHDVAIQVTQMGPVYNWYATFDGVRYQNDDFWPNAPNSGYSPGVPGVFAELSLHPQGPMPNPSSQLGPLTATDYGTGVKALQTYTGAQWRDTQHADALFLNQYCPPLNVYGWGYESASMGTLNGYACAVDYNPLGNW